MCGTSYRQLLFLYSLFFLCQWLQYNMKWTLDQQGFLCSEFCVYKHNITIRNYPFLTWTKTVVFMWRVSTRSDKWFSHSRWSAMDWVRSQLLCMRRKWRQNWREINENEFWSNSWPRFEMDVPQTSSASVQPQQGAHAPVCRSAPSADHQAPASSSGLHLTSRRPW